MGVQPQSASSPEHSGYRRDCELDFWKCMGVRTTGQVTTACEPSGSVVCPQTRKAGTELGADLVSSRTPLKQLVI